jgi:phosphoglycolate phosphatase-like HAD superfamily hydrolase
MSHLEQLKAFTKEKDFFIGIDSDGCAFDTMEIKQKECFIPNTCNYWDLQAVSTMAREAGEFVNLYSQWRGINRFPALVMILELLAERPEALDRGYRLPDIGPLRDWIARETALSNNTLKKEVARTSDLVLQRTLRWSEAVNETVGKIVRNVPPFPHVRAALQTLRNIADVIVVSATPGEALQREWAEHDIARYARMILGQEMGSKKEHLQHCAGGKYAIDHVLMVGDAPGDMKAAKANNCLFFPINPGKEDQSWQRLIDEGLARFTAGTFRGAYEDELVKEFMSLLPANPPWKTPKKCC